MFFVIDEVDIHSVMEPVVSLQKQNVSLELRVFKSMSHQVEHLTPPSAVWSYCYSNTVIIMQGTHKQTNKQTTLLWEREHTAPSAHKWTITFDKELQ